MKVTFGDIKEVFETLPISYYAKRRVNTILEPRTKVGTSYYDPRLDEIHIDASMIINGLLSTPETDDEYSKETAVRSMVYHELSHAILTPYYQPYLDYFKHPAAATVFNIFEDERIETVLENFYIDTNFKKNLLYICGGKVPTPTSDRLSKFYYLVRFRGYQGTSAAKEVVRIINKYSGLNCNSENWKTFEYLKEVWRLWENFAKEVLTENPESEIPTIENNINSMGNGEGFSKNTTEEKEGKNPEDSEDSENSEGSENSEDSEGKNDIPNTKKPNGKGERTIFSKVIEDAHKKFFDASLVESLNNIITTFNKKTNSGNGCTSYSGVLNPRNVARKDFRYFDKKVSAHGNNMYGKLHLNLIIDKSGSFCNLEDSANVLIRALLEVEKKNSNFTFDVLFSGDDLEETTKPRCFVEANGGNGITYQEIASVMPRHKKKDAYVYNIVLHDGRLDWSCGYSSGKNPFLAWDTSNTTIIDTGDNSIALNQLHSARIVTCPYKELVKTLGKQVADTLRMAFR